ncbi:MAG: hypothetical protein JO211_05610, partial [Acidobacteriaceae bacterium]|nr:hypothetical protein [Acidobacteriaceae bacterium]
MDRSQPTYSPVDELTQIQLNARQSNSVEELRRYFERVQTLKRSYGEDFDTHLFIAEVQEEIIERARMLREKRGEPRVRKSAEENPQAHLVRHSAPANGTAQEEEREAAEIAPEVPRVDSKTWQRATYLALFFTLILFAAFFYLVQTARKLNSTPNEVAGQQKQQAANAQRPPVEVAANPSDANPAIPAAPAVRLYTDLVPGNVSIDNADVVDLKDGELVLNNLQPGRHSIRVSGRGGDAAFSFDIAGQSAPRVIGAPVASNVLAVLVSEQGGQARLITNANNSQVLVDGKAAGATGADGLTLENLGTADHDLQVMQGKDRQRFVLTYTPAPTLTVYVKSDPNAGTVVVMVGVDGAEVYINDALYRRNTEQGQLRIPLKVGKYTIRVHKAGFIDPPPEQVEVKKAEEAAVQFHLQPAPQIATLAIKGALHGTMVYVDKDLAALIGADGNANISNVKPGDHVIELRREQALPKRFQRTFHTGDLVTLSGPDVTLDKAVAEAQPVTPSTPPAEPVAPGTNKPPVTTPNYGMEMEGSQVRKGGGFVNYHVPNAPGHYSFAAQAHLGGVFKKSKLQWYAGYRDSDNYVLFTLDGKHAIVHEVRDGKSIEVSRVPFDLESNQWVQADVSVRADSIGARVRSP